MPLYAPDILYPVKYIVKLRTSHPLGDSAKDNTTDRGAVKNTLWTVFGLHNQDGVEIATYDSHIRRRH